MSEAVQYCRESSAYGFKYVVEQRFSLAERSFWAAVVLSGMAVAAVSISFVINETKSQAREGKTSVAYWILLSSYEEWEADPVQTTVDTTAYPIQSVPFPAVTVCVDPESDGDGSDVSARSLLRALHRSEFALALPWYEPLEKNCSATPIECGFGISPKKPPVRALLDMVFERMLNASLSRVSTMSDPDLDQALAKDSQSMMAESKFAAAILAASVASDKTEWERCRGFVLRMASRLFATLGLEMEVAIIVLESKISIMSADCPLLHNSTAKPSLNRATKELLLVLIWTLQGKYYDVSTAATVASFAHLMGPTLEAPNRGPVEINVVENNYSSAELALNDVFSQLVINISHGKVNLSLSDLVRLQSSPDLRQLWRNLPRYSNLAHKCDTDDLWSYWDAYYREVIREARYTAFPTPCQPGELQMKNPMLDHARAAQSCCRLLDQYRRNVEVVLHVMSETRTMPHLYKKMHSSRDHDLMSQWVGARTWSPGDKQYAPAHLPVCRYEGTGWRECALFADDLTNVGNCYTFNGRGVERTFADSRYVTAFKKYFLPGKGKVRQPLAPGKFFGLGFMLDSGKYIEKLGKPGRKSTFRLSVQHPNSTADILGESVLIEAGNEVTVNVEVLVVSSHPDVESLPLKKRNCRFPHEATSRDSLFRDYRQSNCYFECMLDQSRRLCGCVPWNFPHRDADTLCDPYGNTCFRTVMGNASLWLRCDCLPECDNVRYSTSVVVKPFDVEAVCGQTAAKEEMDFDTRSEDLLGFYAKSLPKTDNFPMLLHYEWLVNNRTDIASSACAARLANDVALVNVVLKERAVVKMRQDVKVTFVGRLSSLGGTLGLFTGMSLFSLVEVAFWLYRVVKSKLKG